MALTYLQRKLLECIRAGRFEYDEVPPMSRAGVLSSLSKKGFVEYNEKYRHMARFQAWFVKARPSITKAGEAALREKAPPGQREDYNAAHGVRKLVGLNPISKR